MGKTEVLLELFSREPRFEIISADSVQVYKGLDVGSAKPSLKEQTLIPHHLLDILSPEGKFSAGDFVPRADRAVEVIHGRSKIPIISGGTAFYFSNFLYGLPAAPPASEEVRTRVEEFVESQGVEELHKILEKVDPISHGRLALNDLYRRKRALEVFWTCGRALSEFKMVKELRPHLRPQLFALDRPREELYKRINLRVEAMMARGFIEEVESLLAQGVPQDAPGLKSIGYLQVVRWILGGKQEALSQVVEEIAQESRRYAKRQLTFFRSLPEVTWLEPGLGVEELAKTLRGESRGRSP